MKRLEIYKYENSDLNKDLTSTKFKEFDFGDIMTSGNADIAERDNENRDGRNQRIMKGNSLRDMADPESRLGFKYQQVYGDKIPINTKIDTAR